MKNTQAPGVSMPFTVIPENEFHIGFTMAGAASAGCYTAGAMDYFFEIMDLWTNAKNGKLPEGWDPALLNLVPDHTVIVDAMGGTSAGGMTSVMASIYALAGHVNPVKDPADPEQKKENILYDSWVLMGDEPGRPAVFEKALQSDDLDTDGRIMSLLNSGFIDTICDNAFSVDRKGNNRLPFVSPAFELVLSHTMLRGIPLAVDFTTPGGQQRRKRKNVEHSSYEHFTISHFKLDYNESLHAGKYLPLEPFHPDRAKVMKLATMATGAFPIGLKFREFFAGELSGNYIKNTAERIAFNRLSDLPPADVPSLLFPSDFPDPYKFVSIDGGAINNEPFGEVLGILKERYGKKRPEDDYQYALIMIDPFPDTPEQGEYKQPDDLFSVVPAIIGTLWDQAKVKRAELLDAYSSAYYRGEIFPVRWKKNDKDEKFPIACGAVMAFSGLLDIQFRHHDFFLGRDNARNFYRTFFSLPCTVQWEGTDENGQPVPFSIISCHPVHKNWSKKMVDIFGRPGEDKNVVLLPVVPDLTILKEIADTGKERNPLLRTVNKWPEYDASKLFALQDLLKNRVVKMLDISYEKMAVKNTVAESPAAARWMREYYRSNGWKRFTGALGGIILRLLYKWNKGKIAARISRAAIEWILKDLEEKKLLKENTG